MNNFGFSEVASLISLSMIVVISSYFNSLNAKAYFFKLRWVIVVFSLLFYLIHIYEFGISHKIIEQKYYIIILLFIYLVISSYLFFSVFFISKILKGVIRFVRFNILRRNK